MTITEFLLARIAEDEAVANAAIEDDMGQDGGFEDAYDRLTGKGSMPFVPAFGEAAARMIVWNTPRRVLAECAAKRALVGRYEKFYATRRANWMNPNYAGAMEELKWALQALSAVYADHADYQQEWAC